MTLGTREPYRLGLHDGLVLLPVVVLVDGAAFAAFAVAVHVGATAFARVSVDETVNEHRGLGRTQMSAMLVKTFFYLSFLCVTSFSESAMRKRAPYQTEVGEGRADVHDQLDDVQFAPLKTEQGTVTRLKFRATISSSNV